MALVVKDRVQETTVSIGTGSIVLGGAVAGFQSFSAIGNGNTTYYTITDGTNWEVGIGTYTVLGLILSRDTVLESSNGGSLVNFGVGTKQVFCTYPAERSVSTDATNTFTANQIVSVTDNSNAALRVTQLGTGNALLIEDAANPDSSPVVVDASGNLGVGVTSLAVPLMVRRDQATDTLVDLWNATNNSAASITTRYVTNNVAGSGTSTATITKAKTGAFSISNNDASGFITLGTNGSERMRIDSSGNAGIGASPVSTDKLVVGGSIVALDGGFRVYADTNRANNWLDSTGTTSRFQVGYNPSTTQAYIQTVVSAPLLIATNSVERMRFSVNGGVSFGSSGTAYGTSGQVLQSNGDAAPTWVDVDAGGMTLLGTLTTTSGSTQTLSGLTLTDYKEVKIVLNNVGFSADASLRVEGTNIASSSGNNFNSIWGHTTISLVDGTFSTIAFSGSSNTGVGSYSTSVSRAGEVDLNTADTSIVFSLNTGNFDTGTINVYGVK